MILLAEGECPNSSKQHRDASRSKRVSKTTTRILTILKRFKAIKRRFFTAM